MDKKELCGETDPMCQIQKQGLTLRDRGWYYVCDQESRPISHLTY